MDDDGNCDVVEMDEKRALVNFAKAEKDPADFNTEVKIEVSSIRPSMQSENVVVSQEVSSALVTGESIETVIHNQVHENSPYKSADPIIEVTDEPVSQELVNDELFK